MVAFDHVPEHLVIVGGGYVGLEFAQMYRRFGARVTIIERGSRLAAHEDEDISAALAEMLVAEGVVVRTDADCVALESRSEEHTSELQSLMRISYAVFFLKKKN